jgi:hypothetical protein
MSKVKYGGQDRLEQIVLALVVVAGFVFSFAE